MLYGHRQIINKYNLQVERLNLILHILPVIEYFVVENDIEGFYHVINMFSVILLYLKEANCRHKCMYFGTIRGVFG